MWLIERGHPASMLLALPLPSFDSLYRSAVRLYARDRSDRIYDSFVGSQASAEGMEKVTSSLDKIGQPAQPKNDAASFLQKHGSGI